MKKILVLSVCLTLLVAGAAQAAYTTTDTFTANLTSYTSSISMLSYGTAKSSGGGPMTTSTLYGHALPYLYCLNLDRIIYNQPYSGSAVSLDGEIYGNSSFISNPNGIAYLLASYGSAALNSNEAKALQASIWQLVNNNWDLNYASSPDAIDTLYDKYVAEGLAYAGPDLTGNFYWITPANDMSGITGMTYQAVVAPTPIPGTLMLLGSGLAGLVGMARFRRKRSAN